MCHADPCRGVSAWGATLLAVAAMTASGCDATPDSPEDVVRAFLGHLDRHEVEGAVALLDDGFVFRMGNGSVAAEKDAIPDMLAWDAAAGSRIEVRDLLTSRDTVRARLVERSRFTELLGLGPWVVEAEFVVRDGRIVEETAREIVGDAEAPLTTRFEQALAPIRRWALESRPAEADAVFENGRVARYDGPTARRLLPLIEDYRQRNSG